MGFKNLVKPRLPKITPEQMEMMNTDFEALLDGIGSKNVEVIGGLIQKYKVSPDGIPARIILRLMGEKEVA